MPTSSDILNETLGRVASGDRQAFEVLYRASSTKLYGVVFRIMRSKAAAEDVLQEVYATIWRRAGSFDAAKGQAISWMSMIARNRALDEIRKRSSDNVDIDSIAEPAGDTEHPMEKAERSEGLRKLMTCLSGLEPEKREMIMLAYYHGASREALAVKYAAPTPTIKSWLRRSLIQLRSCLES